MRFQKTLLGVGLVLTLTGCKGVPLATQWKLRSFEPGKADLAPLRVAIGGPAWLRPTPQEGRFLATVTREGEEAAPHKFEIRLQNASHAEDARQLAELGALAGC
jgi:hypothetical protein